MTGTRSAIVKIVCGLAAAICLLTIENIWIDPRVARRSHHRLPSFVPEALSGWWFLILMTLGIAVIFLVVCQILLMKDAKTARWKKVLTGIFVLVAAFLAGEWFVATGGMKAIQRSTPAQYRSVVLHWKASATKNVRYNIYRGVAAGMYHDKLNNAPIDGLTFTDTAAERGATYYYVVRAIDTAGMQSLDSNEQVAAIPGAGE
jgi:hypothetical protein